MKARYLNKKITIQKLGNTVDAFGGIIEGGYTDFATVWASINPVTGKEAFLSNKQNTLETFKDYYIAPL